MNIVRWGLLSTARINRRVIPAIRLSQRAKLAAVASRDLVKGQAYATEWEIPRVFGSYEEMLFSSEIDAVYVSLPNNLHAEWTIKALEAGKHVLVEKPFAITIDEADRMIAASRRTGCVLEEAFMYRHHPQMKLAGEYVREGRLGEIRLVRSAFSFSMDNREGNIRLDPGLGGGALWDVGIYPISFAQFVYGQAPESVAGQQWIGPTGVDESFAGQSNYSAGRSAQLYGGFSIPFFTTAEVHGSRGRLALTRPFIGANDPGSEILFTQTNGETNKLRVESPELYLGEIDNMNAAILDGAQTLITHEESRNHVRTAVALYESARRQQLVIIGETG
jgi:predicted dehydrogenase